MASRRPDPDLTMSPDFTMSYEELKDKYDDISRPYMIVTSKVRYMNKAYLKAKEMDDEYKRLNRDRGPFEERVPHRDRSKTLLCGGTCTLRITDKNRPQLVEFCNAALDKYNPENQGANFVFAELIRINVQPVSGFMYYITFDARDAAANDGAAHTFQAEVYKCNRNNPKVKIMMCQIKPNKAPCAD